MRRIASLLTLLFVIALVVATAATAGRSHRGAGVRDAQVEVCPPSTKPSDTGNGGGQGGGGQGSGGQGNGSGQGGDGTAGSQETAGGGNGGTQGTTGGGNTGDHANGGNGNAGGNSNADGNAGGGNGNGNAGGNGNGGGNGNRGGNGHGNGGGNGSGSENADCVNPPADPAPGAVAGDGTLPVAKAGESVNVERVDGVVAVREPGSDSFTPLDASAHLAEGTVLDTRAGTVELTTEGANDAQQTAAFSGAKFSVRQAKKAAVTDLVLRGGNFRNCPRLDHGRRAQAVRNGLIAARGSKRRRLWGNGHGRFRSRGRWGSATVRGTIWQVEDRCDGTLTTVARGVVEVNDFGMNRTVSVRAGEQYFARVRR